MFSVKVGTQRVDFDGTHSLGGNGPENFSRSNAGDLELNKLIFSFGQDDCEVISMDTLYGGDFCNHVNSEKTTVCASHSHFSPMIDSSKPLLGVIDNVAVNKWLRANEVISLKKVGIESVLLHSAACPTQIYRRYDYPGTFLQKLINSRIGLFPNVVLKIDHHIKVFEFRSNQGCEFIIIYFAGHPTAETDSFSITSSYIGILRRCLRESFGEVPILFLQGCGADLRPNITQKRIAKFPKIWLNQKFKSPPSKAETDYHEDLYVNAITNLKLIETKPVDQNICKKTVGYLKIQGWQKLNYTIMHISGFQFHFVPFEMSHLFHQAIQNKDSNIYLVSCVNQTYGYLPFPSQLKYGGYEVDKSRKFMNIPNRLVFESATFYMETDEYTS